MSRARLHQWSRRSGNGTETCCGEEEVRVAREERRRRTRVPARVVRDSSRIIVSCVVQKTWKRRTGCTIPAEENWGGEERRG